MKFGIYDAVSKFFKSMDKRFKTRLAAIRVHSWTNGLLSQYNLLYVTALGANSVELGSLNGLGGTVNSVISIPVGWIIDKYGVKKVIITGLILSAAVAGIYGSAFNWWMPIPARVLTQISMRMIVPLTDIIFVETTRPEERAFAMGF